MIEPEEQKELISAFGLDIAIATQSNPAIVSQLMAWQMLKGTSEWPPESMAQVVQISRQLHQVLGNITPYMETTTFVPDNGEEEIDE